MGYEHNLLYKIDTHFYRRTTLTRSDSFAAILRSSLHARGP